MNETLYEQRLHRILAALDGTGPDCVPIRLEYDPAYLASLWGADLMQASWDSARLVELYGKTTARVDCDATFGLPCQFPALYAMLGSQNWVQHKESGSMQHPELCVLQDEDYDALIADPMACIERRLLPRIHRSLSLPYPDGALALAKAQFYQKTVIDDYYAKLYEVEQANGAPSLYGTIFYAPFDLLADHLRGVRGALMDLRRRPRQVREACEVLADLLIRYVRASFPPPEGGFPMACCWVHMAPFMNDRQFDEIYFPSFKRVCDTLAADGYALFLQFQGDYGDGRLFDRIAALPARRTLISVEQSAPGALERVLGETHCISGSLPAGTLRACRGAELERAVRGVLERGMGCRRYVFDFGKPPLTREDAPLEQLQAMCALVRRYGIYKP